MQTWQFLWWNDTNISLLFLQDYTFVDVITAQKMNIQCLFISENLQLK